MARQLPETFETRREAEAAAKAIRCGSRKPETATAVDLGPYAGRKRYGVLVRCPGDPGLALAGMHTPTQVRRHLQIAAREHAAAKKALRRKACSEADRHYREIQHHLGEALHTTTKTDSNRWQRTWRAHNELKDQIDRCRGF